MEIWKLDVWKSEDGPIICGPEGKDGFPIVLQIIQGQYRYQRAKRIVRLLNAGEKKEKTL